MRGWQDEENSIKLELDRGNVVTVHGLNLCTLSIAEITPMVEQCAVQQNVFFSL